MTWIELGKVMWPMNVGGTLSLCIERRKPISTNYCECSAISTNDSQRIIKVAECESIWYQSITVALAFDIISSMHSIYDTYLFTYILFLIRSFQMHWIRTQHSMAGQDACRKHLRCKQWTHIWTMDKIVYSHFSSNVFCCCSRQTLTTSGFVLPA